jgi:hypothetical protein
MAYLVTLRTYDKQAEAEIDKSLLEANGFAVNLLNHDSSLSEFGGMLRIQLQVPSDEAKDAGVLLQEARPRRTGSIAIVRNEEASIRCALVRLGITVLVVSILFFLLGIVLELPLVRCLKMGIGGAILLSIPCWLIVEFLRRKTKRC